MSECFFRLGRTGGVTLTLHVQPGSRRSEWAGLYGDALKVRLAAPPVDGKANAALCEFVSKKLGIPQSAIQLIAGQTSRRKVVRIDPLPAGVFEQLQQLGQNSSPS